LLPLSYSAHSTARRVHYSSFYCQTGLIQIAVIWGNIGEHDDTVRTKKLVSGARSWSR